MNIVFKILLLTIFSLGFIALSKFPFFSLTIYNSSTIIGSGMIQKKEQKLIGIVYIEARGVFTINVEESQEESLTIQADDNIMPIIKTEINSNNLTIKTDGSFSSENPIMCWIKVKDIKTIDLHGNITASITINNPKNDFSLTAYGSSTVNGKLIINNLFVFASGSSKITLSGLAHEQNLNLSGATIYNALHLQSKKVLAKITGASKAELQVTDEIRGVVSGASGVYYKGNPHIALEISGVGSIQKL